MAYVDTSALVKLVIVERGSAALRRWLSGQSNPVSSDLARTELMRAVRRTDPDQVEKGRRVLGSIDLIQVTTATFESAGRLDPAPLRSLDALHLAVALELGDDLDTLVTYDERLAVAARGNGIHVTAPS